MDSLVKMLGKMHDATNDHLQCLANHIGYEFNLTKSLNDLFDLVGVVPGLAIRQQFLVCGYILDKMKRLNFFMDLREDARKEYVLMGLEEFLQK